MEGNPSFKYWYKVLKLEKNILLLVRSLRQSNLLLFIATLQHHAPILFTLDHTHYSRRTSVIIRDLLLLPEKNHRLFIEFLRGCFAVNKIKDRSTVWLLTKLTNRTIGQSKRKNNSGSY